MNGRFEVENKIEARIKNKLISCPDYLYDWYMNLKANNSTPATCYDYLNKVIQMLMSYQNHYPTINELSQRHTIEYFDSIQKIKDRKGNVKYSSSSYQQNVWCALSNFFDFLYRTKLISNNYMETIKRPKDKDSERIKNERVLLTQDDFNKILSSVNGKSNNYKVYKERTDLHNRDKLIICLFMTTGMRKTALTEIDINDIDLDRCKLSIIDKGKKYHIYSLSDDIMEYIKKWLLDRENIKGHEKTDALFISEKGDRLTGNAIVKIVEKYSKAGLGYSISPHKLRAGFCSILYDKKHDIEFVRKVVGHANIRTTQRYIVTDNTERKEAVDIMSDLLKM